MSTPLHNQAYADSEIETLRLRVANLEALLAVRDQTIARAAERERLHTLALQAVASADQLLKGVLDHIPAAVYIRDLDGRCLLANHTAVALLGSNLALLPDNRREDGHNSEQGVYWQRAERRVAETGSVFRREVELELQGGTCAFISTQFPIRDKAGVITGVGGILEDITDRKRAEEEARRSAAYSEAILSAIPGLIFIMSADGDYLDYRTDNEDLLLAPPRAFLGKNVREVLPHKAEAFLQLSRAARETGKVQNWAFAENLPDGTRYFEGQTAALGDELTLLIIREVTERKQLEAEHARIQEELIRVQAAALAELPTPLIRVNDRVLVMPLVGLVDARRALQVLQGLADGVGGLAASIAILDVTGVPLVDSQIAGVLLRAARAVKQRGASLLVTGVSPEVAQALANLDTGLSELVFHDTLQSGIAYAMACA